MEWKDIKSWEGLYEVNSQGEVRNKKTGKLIKGDKNSIGYHRVQLFNCNHEPQRQRFFRHRLVAEAFIPNPNNLPEVNHIDSNIDHNYKENLEWVDRKYNELYSRICGDKEFKPFEVTFDDKSKKVYLSKQKFADEIGVTKAAVKFWLHDKNQGYLNRGILNIHYI